MPWVSSRRRGATSSPSRRTVSASPAATKKVSKRNVSAVRASLPAHPVTGFPGSATFAARRISAGSRPDSLAARSMAAWHAATSLCRSGGKLGSQAAGQLQHPWPERAYPDADRVGRRGTRVQAFEPVSFAGDVDHLLAAPDGADDLDRLGESIDGLPFGAGGAAHRRDLFPECSGA